MGSLKMLAGFFYGASAARSKERQSRAVFEIDQCDMLFFRYTYHRFKYQFGRKKMRRFLYRLAVVTGFVCAAGAATAATESYAFDATLSSGSVLCGAFVGLEAPCPSLFGVVDEANAFDDLMVGLAVGGTYPGRIDLTYDELGGRVLALSGAACTLNGKNCSFSDAFLPIGAPSLGASPGTLDFSLTSVVESRFTIFGDTGTYDYSTDYLFRGDGSIYYYTGVSFELSDVTFSPVPLPSTATGLLAAFGVLSLMRRKKAKRSV